MSIDLSPKLKEGRPLAVLIPLLILHLTLLSIQIQDPAGNRLLKRWILLAEAPFLNASSGISESAKGFWRDYLWLHGAREENRRLLNLVQQLSAQEKALEQVQQENLRLRQLVALTNTLPFETIGAHVVGRTPSYLSNLLYIDRGSADGVTSDAPVVSGGGILGRVVLVSAHNAQVQLVTNPDASVGVLIERDRAPGVAKGTGSPTLELDYISNSEQIAVGDEVTSSGLDGVFPKGLVLGKVVESSKGNSVFRVIRVEPRADLLRVEEVSVLLSAPKRTSNIPDHDQAK